MDWIVDRRSPDAAARTLERVEHHLRSHAAVETGVAQAAAGVREAVEAQSTGTPLWLHLAWPRLTVHPVTRIDVRDGAVPLSQRAALADASGPELAVVDLGLERRVLRTFEDGPPPMPQVDVELERDGVAAVAVALLAAAEAHPAASPAQTASLAGTLLADAVEPPATAAEAAALFVAVQRALGGEAEVLRSDDASFEVGVTRSPYGPGAVGHPSVDHLSTGVAGRLAAKVDGTAAVEVEESPALGDDECRLRVVLGASSDLTRGELHRWPPSATTIDGPAPHLDLSVILPSESGSVPVVRRLAAQALRAFGVHGEDIDDVQLAITEACGNVIDHVSETDTYEVRFALAADRCAISVLDQGEGFDATVVPEDMDVTAEDGRGLALMRALVDTLAFRSEPHDGAVVHMVKNLRYDAAHPLRQSAR
ncbi:MAG TPA: ATP-binding protein [Marmoricola sp.]|nr:ATP-binding protein [Marmoricola sp.]